MMKASQKYMIWVTYWSVRGLWKEEGKMEMYGVHSKQIQVEFII